MLFLVASELEQLVASDEDDTIVDRNAAVEELVRTAALRAGVVVELGEAAAKLRASQRRREAVSLLRQVCKGWCCIIDAGLQDLHITR